MSAPVFDDDRPVHEQAAYWLNEMRSGDMSARQVRAFEVWMDCDVAHRQAYSRLERHWRTLGMVAEDPEIMEAREHDRRSFRHAGLQRHCAMAASAVLIVGAGWIGLGLAGLPNGIGTAHAEQRFTTRVGQTATVTLDDGTKVTLDTDSALRVSHSDGQRQVRMERGRAFFDVAEGDKRPFMVLAHGKKIVATHTAFDVRLDRDDVTVTLKEGRVRIEPQIRLARLTASPVEIGPGDQFSAKAGRVWKVAQVDVGREQSWLDGRLTFFHDGVDSAVTEMNRYSQTKLVFTDGQAPDHEIVGVFQAGDVSNFAKAIEISGSARIVSRTDKQIVMDAIP